MTARKKRPTHGGTRAGAGRKPTLQDPVRLTIMLARADVEALGENASARIRELIAYHPERVVADLLDLVRDLAAEVAAIQKPRRPLPAAATVLHVDYDRRARLLARAAEALPQ